MQTIEQTVEQARTWAQHDPDPATRAELEQLIAAVETHDAKAGAELQSRFAGPLTFGTAGLRGQVAAGESRMNVAVVTRATAGVAQYVIDTVGAQGRVVVGCDARHGSQEFYAATVEVLAAAGLTVLALPRQLPTPLTAFAVRDLDADAGIMITASHNPAADNGYKVYLGGRIARDAACGVQLVPPADAEISARIAVAPAADEVARSRVGITQVGDDIMQRYVERMAGHRHIEGACEAKVVITAMHGVGGALAQQVLAKAGIDAVYPVVEQMAPDPDFPTVPFPNPEEPGALDLSIALATKMSADVVVALDPDADRCAVAIPLRAGGWRPLSGDELGAVLGEQAAADPTREGDALACSIVSSRLLARIADHHGLRAVNTLTGFKWIARTPGMRFGYEEAIGYCTDPGAVRDKDGIGAMVYVVALAETLARQGRTIEDLLDDLARTHGLHATAPLSFRVGDLSIISDAMARLRQTGIDQLAGSPVVECTDLTHGADGMPPTDGLRYLTQAGDRVVIRPSGTEPKLKCYLEVILPCTDGQVPRAAASRRLEQIKADLRAVLAIDQTA